VRAHLAGKRVKAIDPQAADSGFYFIGRSEFKRRPDGIAQRRAEDTTADPGSLFVVLGHNHSRFVMC
jgi:hypothetical protein